MTDKIDIYIDNLTNLFQLSPNDLSVFKHLISRKLVAVQELSKATSVKRTTLYGVLNNLQNLGLISESEVGRVKKWSVSSISQIEGILEKKSQSIKEAKNGLQDLFSLVGEDTIFNSDIRIYRGKEGIKFILEDMLMYRNISTEAFWPIKKMITVLGSEFFKYLNKERIKKKIYTKAIWPNSQVIDTKKYPYLGSGVEFSREIRVAPDQVNFSMGYWIYGDKVAFISSESELFGFIIKSKDFTEMLRVQFNLVWKLSKPLKQKKNPEVDSFLESVYR